MIDPQKLSAVDFYQGMELEEIACPVCGNDRHEHLFQGDRYGMGITTVGCAQCGLIFVNPRPTPAAMNTFYEKHYRRFYESVERPTEAYVQVGPFRDRAAYVVDVLSTYVTKQKNARVLDIGCAEGTLLQFLGKSFPQLTLHGLEPDPNFADYARAHSSASKVHSCDFHSFFSTNELEFEVVTLTHVLEHILDPIRVLQCIRNLLNDDGILYVEVPNIADSRAKGLGHIHLGHVLSFDAETLQSTLQVAGFRLERFYQGDLPARTPAMAAVCKRDERTPYVPVAPSQLKQKFNRYREVICGLPAARDSTFHKRAS